MVMNVAWALGGWALYHRQRATQSHQRTGGENKCIRVILTPCAIAHNYHCGPLPPLSSWLYRAGPDPTLSSWKNGQQACCCCEWDNSFSNTQPLWCCSIIDLTTTRFHVPAVHRSMVFMAALGTGGCGCCGSCWQKEQPRYLVPLAPSGCDLLAKLQMMFMFQELIIIHDHDQTIYSFTSVCPVNKT